MAMPMPRPAKIAKAAAVGSTSAAPNAAAMFFLNATNPQTIKFMRSAMVDVGFKAQRLANDLLRRVALADVVEPARR